MWIKRGNLQCMYIFLRTHNHGDVGEREPVVLGPYGEVAAEVEPLLGLVLHRLAVVQPLHVILHPLLPRIDKKQSNPLNCKYNYCFC